MNQLMRFGAIEENSRFRVPLRESADGPRRFQSMTLRLNE